MTTSTNCHLHHNEKRLSSFIRPCNVQCGICLLIKCVNGLFLGKSEQYAHWLTKHITMNWPGQTFTSTSASVRQYLVDLSTICDHGFDSCPRQVTFTTCLHGNLSLENNFLTTILRVVHYVYSFDLRRLDAEGLVNICYYTLRPFIGYFLSFL